MWSNYVFLLSFRGNLGELDNTIQFKVEYLNTYGSEGVDIFSFEWKTNHLANLRLIFIYVKHLSLLPSFLSLMEARSGLIGAGEAGR